jgi:hypothetical protein
MNICSLIHIYVGGRRVIYYQVSAHSITEAVKSNHLPPAFGDQESWWWSWRVRELERHWH